MKLALVAATIFTLTLGFYTPKVTAAPIKTPKTFKEWCQQKASLPQETRRTVEALLNVAETQNCSQANQTLTKLTEVDLTKNPLTSKQCPLKPESICKF